MPDKSVEVKPANLRRRRCGVCAERNGAWKSDSRMPLQLSSRLSSEEKGWSIAANSFSMYFESVVASEMAIRHTRSGCCRAAITRYRVVPVSPYPEPMSTILGRGGRFLIAIALSLAGLFSVKRSRKCKRAGDVNTTCRHFRHT